MSSSSQSFIPLTSPVSGIFEVHFCASTALPTLPSKPIAMQMLHLSYALRTNLPTNWRMAGHEAKVHRWIVGHRLRTIQRWICPSVVIVMVRQFSGEFEFICGDNQFQWWSDNSPVNCRTQAQDNSAVNLPKRGDKFSDELLCPEVLRWTKKHRSTLVGSFAHLFVQLSWNAI